MRMLALVMLILVLGVHSNLVKAEEITLTPSRPSNPRS